MRDRSTMTTSLSGSDPSSNLYDAISLSGNSDPDLVRDFISYEKKTNTLRKAGFKVYIKGSPAFDNGHLVVSPNRLSDQEYDHMFTSAQVSISLMGSYFRFRVSGSLLDAVEHNCRIVASKYPMAIEFSKTYPHLVSCFDDVPQAFNQIIRAVSSNCMSDDMDCDMEPQIFNQEKWHQEAKAIQASHSQQTLADSLDDALGRVLCKGCK
ncbi:hypothetical protein EGYY_07190 [Eggerthella sp. YY7918]|nr:hypothetical protein EGYY_07190 [Eggerthella sp. YY7918]